MAQHISVRIPARLLTNLDALAQRLGLSRTDAILNAITLQNTMFEPHYDETETTPNGKRNSTIKHKRASTDI